MPPAKGSCCVVVLKLLVAGWDDNTGKRLLILVEGLRLLKSDTGASVDVA